MTVENRLSVPLSQEEIDTLLSPVKNMVAVREGLERELAFRGDSLSPEETISVLQIALDSSYKEPRFRDKARQLKEVLARVKSGEVSPDELFKAAGVVARPKAPEKKVKTQAPEKKGGIRGFFGR